MDDNEFHDVAEPSDGPTTPLVQPERTEREGVPWAAILVAVWAVALVIFSVQNADDAAVRFLGWSFQMPVAILVIVTALVTLVLTGIGSIFYRRRRRKRAKLKREHRELSESDE
jgi:uncharacterized integral membrane protein